MCKNSLFGKAEKCIFNHACLDSIDFPKCSGLALISNEVLLVKGQEKLCNYQVKFGNKLFCLCPVRIELFKDNNIKIQS